MIRRSTLAVALSWLISGLYEETAGREGVNQHPDTFSSDTGCYIRKQTQKKNTWIAMFTRPFLRYVVARWPNAMARIAWLCHHYLAIVDRSEQVATIVHPWACKYSLIDCSRFFMDARTNSHVIFLCLYFFVISFNIGLFPGNHFNPICTVRVRSGVYLSRAASAAEHCQTVLSSISIKCKKII